MTISKEGGGPMLATASQADLKESHLTCAYLYRPLIINVVKSYR
jgi:hypothetical protein